MIRTRHSSLESSPYFDSIPKARQNFNSTHRQDSDDSDNSYDPMKFRSHSSEKVMQPLSFNKIQEDIQHPLSSLRSCSEFNNFGSSQIRHQIQLDNKKSKPFWKKIFSFSRIKQPKEIDSSSNHSLTSSFSSTTSRSLSSDSKVISTFMENVTEPSYKLNLNKTNRQQLTMSEEFGFALDVVFGYNTINPRHVPPMEIELKSFSNSVGELSRVSSGGHTESSASVGFPRNNSTTSNRSSRSNRSNRSNSAIRSSRSDSSADVSDPENERGSNNNVEDNESSVGYPPEFHYFSFQHWQHCLCNWFESSTLWFRRYCVPGDNDLFYNLQIQPFSSGIYLRGMLATGSNSLIFHTYTLLFLPAEIRPAFWSETTVVAYGFEWFMVTLLIIQVVLNIIIAPVRLVLHYECWQTTRAYDTQRASAALQDLIETNIWLFNRMVAWTLDVIGVLVVVIGELYLISRSSYFSSLTNAFFDNASSDATSLSEHVYSNTTSVVDPYDTKDSLSSLIIEMCSTNILSFLLRATVALIYYLSIADTEILNGKRRRKGGLSNFDLDLMPTFVFSDSDEVVNNECSICLTNFEMGEMLISLPCHKRHSFHAGCIREWLQHDAKCPLCQKSI